MSSTSPKHSHNHRPRAATLSLSDIGGGTTYTATEDPDSEEEGIPVAVLKAVRHSSLSATLPIHWIYPVSEYASECLHGSIHQCWFSLS